MTDHDLTVALFLAVMARQPLDRLHQLRATMQQAGNRNAVRLVDDELARRGEPMTTTEEAA